MVIQLLVLWALQLPVRPPIILHLPLQELRLPLLRRHPPSYPLAVHLSILLYLLLICRLSCPLPALPVDDLLQSQQSLKLINHRPLRVIQLVFRLSLLAFFNRLSPPSSPIPYPLRHLNLRLLSLPLSFHPSRNPIDPRTNPPRRKGSSNPLISHLTVTLSQRRRLVRSPQRKRPLLLIRLHRMTFTMMMGVNRMGMMILEQSEMMEAAVLRMTEAAAVEAVPEVEAATEVGEGRGT